MKFYKLLMIVICMAFLSTTTGYAQNEQAAQEKVYKTTTSEVPVAVKEALQNYSGYEIAKEASFTKKSTGTVYTFKLQKGPWTHLLLIDEKGKVIGTRSAEGSR
ncbi:MAG: hypothetical protein OEW87_04535 [Flavobacteriaceae bacterium]|nr:hypothetical protein [Flavobacteriaceae bacterium]